uniref:Beta-galactosidase n=1 Tax=Homalodisca liturata TaxID=320908 RepID=A0A1B6JXA2_9HEMI
MELISSNNEPLRTVSSWSVSQCGAAMTIIGLCVVLAVVALRLATAVSTIKSQYRVFEIDYQNNRFLKDGEPFQYVSGSLHYFRVPRVYWRERLRQYRAAGLNAVCTYIEWSRHESSPGTYSFSGENDFEYFVQLAQEEDLLVILRPGPYICSERDFGGYPTWLLHENPNMGLRTNESSHTHFVESWLSVLFPRIQPLLYGNGGPVIMLQVENEYGSFSACDGNYTRWLRDVFRTYVGDNAVLLTTDGAGSGYLKCGTIPGVLATVDFGPTTNVSREFDALRQYQKHGPLVNSEFYTGWLTHWGDPKMASRSTSSIVNSTRQLLALNASFNFYVFHGGTSFGLSTGANISPFLPQVTSYDFDAPISESGNLTEKYYAIRSVISEFMPVPDIPVESSGTMDYGTVLLAPKISLFDSQTAIEYPAFEYPQTFESLEQYSGFMFYETRLPPRFPGLGYLVANNVHDRTIVCLNKRPVGVLSRSDNIYQMILVGQAGQMLGLLVENQGHINYQNMTDLKGLVENVTLNGDILTGWTHTGYPMTNVSQIATLPNMSSVALPAFFGGSFSLPTAAPRDVPLGTFVDMTGWGKGILYVNGYNLGRYWPEMGPQMSLYLPGSFLRQNNTVLVMELGIRHPNTTLRLVAEPVVNLIQHSHGHNDSQINVQLAH